MSAWTFCARKMKEYRDASNRLSIDLSDLDSEILFAKYADRIKSEFKAIIVDRLDGLDQRYWDFDIDGKIVVLHSDSMTGISIHIENGADENLLRKIALTLIK